MAHTTLTMVNVVCAQKNVPVNIFKKRKDNLRQIKKLNKE